MNAKVIPSPTKTSIIDMGRIITLLFQPKIQIISLIKLEFMTEMLHWIILDFTKVWSGAKCVFICTMQFVHGFCENKSLCNYNNINI